MKKNKRKKLKIRSAQVKALFHSGMFDHKIESDKTKYNRKRKHRDIIEEQF